MDAEQAVTMATDTEIVPGRAACIKKGYPRLSLEMMHF